MITILEISIEGSSELGDYRGSFSFEAGLQVVSANNGFGKSLAVTAIAWCLGLEPIFGVQDNDISRFPSAVRDVVDLGDDVNVPVLESRASILIQRSDGARLRSTRDIKGTPAKVVVEEFSSSGEALRVSTLNARERTMKDETGGLHNFLFSWLGWTRSKVFSVRGESGEVYLENLAPLFLIDQIEGWSDLQALQVYRYGIPEIAEIAVEYLLGATANIAARLERLKLEDVRVKQEVEASLIASRVSSFMERNGWIVPWSDHGRATETARRWSARPLALVLKEEVLVDLPLQMAGLRSRADKLRKSLTDGGFDSKSSAAASDSSQIVVELKGKRHQRREDLRLLRRQKEDQSELLMGIQHRLRSARDVLRLKTQGVGRLELVQCPTCQRQVEPSTFSLAQHSLEAVSAHIEALDRDRRLISSNMTALEQQLVRVSSDLSETEAALQDAQRALLTVNRAVGESREQLAKLAADIIGVENEIERVAIRARELAELQRAIDSWLDRVKATAQVDVASENDSRHRLTEFRLRLGRLLRALGHSAILAQPLAEVTLDARYIPYLGPRRLRSLGSASDHPRLIAAYVLALAATSEAIGGLHPGVVVLDEPLQQNPDENHRSMFIEFLISETATSLKGQTIIFTWLHGPELGRLRAAGVRVFEPDTSHFLHLLPRSDSADSEGVVTSG
jgi:hypothetical protein